MPPPPSHRQPLIFFSRVIILAKLGFKIFREIFNKETRNHFVWFVSENQDKTWSISKVLIIVHLKSILPRAAVWLEISGVIPHLVCSCQSWQTTSLDHGAGPRLWCGAGPDLYMSVGLEGTYESRHTVRTRYICIMKCSTIMNPSRPGPGVKHQYRNWSEG